MSEADSSSASACESLRLRRGCVSAFLALSRSNACSSYNASCGMWLALQSARQFASQLAGRSARLRHVLGRRKAKIGAQGGSRILRERNPDPSGGMTGMPVSVVPPWEECAVSARFSDGVARCLRVWIRALGPCVRWWRRNMRHYPRSDVLDPTDEMIDNLPAVRVERAQGGRPGGNFGGRRSTTSSAYKPAGAGASDANRAAADHPRAVRRGAADADQVQHREQLARRCGRERDGRAATRPASMSCSVKAGINAPWRTRRRT